MQQASDRASVVHPADPDRGSRPVRAVVVDDSGLMRRLIKAALEAETGIEAVGLAEDVSSARRMIRALNPDVVTLDVEMPGMNGLEFLEKIMELRPMPVVMVSSHTAEGTDASLAALQMGAVDVVEKPRGVDPNGPFGRTLREKVRLAARARVRARRPSRAPSAAMGAAAIPTRSFAQPAPAVARAAGRAPSLLAIGASTGGVAALTELLAGLPAQMPPIVITQHMPAGYTARFAGRLHERLGFDVAEARDGEPLRRGSVRIAPGDRHLQVQAGPNGFATRLGDATPVSGHCPSVDVLFGSVANAAGAGAAGVILTGMGRDGAAGLRAMRAAGARCLGQSERSCVVYGMPRAARQLGAVHEELDLDRIPQRLRELVGAAGRAAP